jgi:hypothetical protein
VRPYGVYALKGCCGRLRFVGWRRRYRSFDGEAVREKLGEVVVVVAYEVTGISPQSMTLPQKLKGLEAMGLEKKSVMSRGFWKEPPTRCSRH